jgi:hypothetical protein
MVQRAAPQRHRGDADDGKSHRRRSHSERLRARTRGPCRQQLQHIDADDRHVAVPQRRKEIGKSIPAQFQFAARVTSPARDPLAEARRFLDDYGETGEGQALRRFMDTLASDNGEFAESEVWLFSAETLALVAALVEARISGRYPDAEWRHK